MTAIPAPPPLPTLRLVHASVGIRRFARFLMFLFAAAPFALLLVPYQQAISGTGQVVAYNQEERQSPVVAPIDGRVVRWHVKEGQTVTKGQPIADIQDNDPEFVGRLQKQRAAIEDRKKANEGRIAALTEQIYKLTQSRDQAITAAEQRQQAAQRDVTVTQQSVVRVEAALKLSEQNLAMQRNLVAQGGLASRFDLQRAEQDNADKVASLEASKAAVSKAQDTVLALTADVQRITNTENAAIEGARANLEMANDTLNSTIQLMIDVDVRISRQRAQQITSDVDGVVWQVGKKATVGQYVKVGEVLAEIVPDTAHPVVELLVDGNDLPLLLYQEGHRARIQFEGWPAVQFVGWPSVAVGTFAGKVKLVDATDNDKGQFRVLIEPLDPAVDDDYDLTDDWPGRPGQRDTGGRNHLLRQGMRANGWVFLNRVPLGWELWRRINGFPPVATYSDPHKGDAKPAKAKGKK